MSSTVPEILGPGFQPHSSNAFMVHCGPFYDKVVDGHLVEVAVKIDNHHGNSALTTHGGMLMTIADGALGAMLHREHDEPVTVTTISMTTNFLGPSATGDWLIAKPRILKRGYKTIFAECDVFCNGEKVLGSVGVFSIKRRT